MLTVIDKSQIHQYWSLVEGHLGSALNYTDDYNLDQIKVYLAKGEWILIAVLDGKKIDGAIAITFVNYPNNRVAFITAIGGKLISNKDNFKQFQDILRMYGATKIQGAVRPSVARLWRRLGFVEKNITVESSL